MSTGEQDNGKGPRAATKEDLIALFRALSDRNADYVLLGGQALNLHGYMRGTGDIDLLLPMSEENGRMVIDALSILPDNAAKDVAPEWLAESGTIRVADEIVVDLMTVAANGETYDSLKPHIQKREMNGYSFFILDLEGLLKTKNSVRPKDKQDATVIRSMLSRTANRATGDVDHHPKGLFRFFRKMLGRESAGTDAPRNGLEMRGIPATEKETQPSGPALRTDGSLRPDAGGNASANPKACAVRETGGDGVRYAGCQETAGPSPASEPDVRRTGDPKPE